MRWILGLALSLAVLTKQAGAHDYRLEDIEISHPHTGVTTASSLSAAGYLRLINHGTLPDRLIGIRTDAGMAMIHLSLVDDQGIASMKMLPDGIEIPAGATVTLEPGALHVMFTDLAAPFVAGAMIPATLSFAKAGSIAVEFEVEAKGAPHRHGADAKN